MAIESDPVDEARELRSQLHHVRVQLLGAVDAARGAEAERAAVEAQAQELKHRHHMLEVERDELRRRIEELEAGNNWLRRRLGRQARRAVRRLVDVVG